MQGQLSLFEPDFLKDRDCTAETPVTRGKKDKPIYGTGKRIKPRVPGRRETKHTEEIYLKELLPLEEYDMIVVLISGGKDSIATYFKLRELGLCVARGAGALACLSAAATGRICDRRPADGLYEHPRYACQLAFGGGRIDTWRIRRGRGVVDPRGDIVYGVRGHCKLYPDQL